MKRISTSENLHSLSASQGNDSDESVDHVLINLSYIQDTGDLSLSIQDSDPPVTINTEAKKAVLSVLPEIYLPKYVAITTNLFSHPADLKDSVDNLKTQYSKDYYSLDKNGHEQFFSSLNPSILSSTCKVPEYIIIVLAHVKGEIFPEKQITSLIQCLAKIQTQYPRFDFRYGLRDLAELSAESEALDHSFFYQRLSHSGFGTFMQTTLEEQEETLFYEQPKQKTKNEDEAIEMENLVKPPITIASLKGRLCLYFDPFDDKKPVTEYIGLFNQRYVPEQKRLEVWSRASDRILNRILEDKRMRAHQNMTVSMDSFSQTFFHSGLKNSSTPFEKLEETLSDASSEVTSEPPFSHHHRTPFRSACCTLL